MLEASLDPKLKASMPRSMSSRKRGHDDDYNNSFDGNDDTNDGGEDAEDDDGHEDEDEEGESEKEWLRDENIPLTSHIIGVQLKGKVDKHSDAFTVSANQGIEQFCTAGTIFSIFTKTGMKWVAEKVGDPTIPEKLSQLFTSIHSDHVSALRPYVETNSHKLVPSPQVVDLACRMVSLCKEPWDILVSEQEIRRLVRSLSDPNEPPIGYAENLLLHSICAAAIPLVIYAGESEKYLNISRQQAWEIQAAHTSAAMAHIYNVTIMGPSILSLRAMLVAIISFHICNAHPIEALTPLALRFAYMLGLHRWESVHGLPAEEANNRRRLWWMAYNVDCDVALKIGRCPGVLEFDISQKLPDPTPMFAMLDFDVYNALSRLGIIFGRVYEKLYSAQASLKPPSALIRDILDLDKQLLEWYESVPEKYRPGSDLSFLDQHFEAARLNRESESNVRFFVLGRGILHLHCYYFQLISMLHRITAYHPSWVYATMTEDKNTNNSPSTATGTTNTNGCNTGPNSCASTPSGSIKPPRSAGKYARLFQSLEICVKSARETLAMVKRGRSWGNEHLPGAAFYASNSFITLFIKCLSRPRDSTVKTDLSLMYEVVDMFNAIDESLIPQFYDSKKKNISQFWSTLFELAQSYVIRAQNSNSPASSDKINTPDSDKIKVSMSPITGSSQQPAQAYSGGLGYGIPVVNAQLSQMEPGINQGHPNGPYPVDAQNGAAPSDGGMFDISNGEISLAQGLYQMSSYFYAWDPDLFYSDTMINPQ